MFSGGIEVDHWLKMGYFYLKKKILFHAGDI